MNTAPLRGIYVAWASRPRIACLLVCHVAIAFGLVACGDTSVKEEQIEKGTENIPAPEQTDKPTSGQPADSGTPEQSDPDFPWAVPQGWAFDDTPRQMRIATYMAPTESGEQEVAVTRFPGRVGGELANINRWRGQMGLTPISESDLEDSIERFTADGYDGYMVRIVSDRGTMLAAGVFDESIDKTWFVRATLTDTTLADQLDDEIFGMARSIAR